MPETIEETEALADSNRMLRAEVSRWKSAYYGALKEYALERDRRSISELALKRLKEGYEANGE